MRRAMGIELEGCVVVIDEAHNIEDAAREAASASVSDADLTAAITGLEGLLGSCIFFPRSRSLMLTPLFNQWLASESAAELAEAGRHLLRLARDLLAWIETADAPGATRAAGTEVSERVRADNGACTN